jgi:hypothetical protein
VNNNAVNEAITTRLFSNSVYRWITGIVLYAPIRSWELSTPPATMTLHANKNAQFPMSDSLRRLLNGAAEFHGLPAD